MKKKSFEIDLDLEGPLLTESGPITESDPIKEQQSLSKAHYFYFKINIISKSTTAFVLTRI